MPGALCTRGLRREHAVQPARALPHHAPELPAGKIWISDAFASVSNTLVLRGTTVLVSRHFHEYWTLTELCFAGGYDIAKLSSLFIYPEIGHAEFLTLYLCAVDFLGFATKTRIDPAFTILAFKIAFNARVQIARVVFPTVVQIWFSEYTVDVVESGIAHAALDRGKHLKVESIIHPGVERRDLHAHILRRSLLSF